MRNKMIYSVRDIYKDNLRKRCYLSLFALKLPLLLKRYKKNRVEYRLFFILPFMRKKNNGEDLKLFFTQKYSHYQSIIQRIKTRFDENKPIRVGFLVMYDSVFSARAIYEKMLADSAFEPFIVVIPDTARGEENMRHQSYKTYQSFASYPRVFASYDTEKEAFIDFADRLDIVFFSSPYDSMTHRFYTIAYLSRFALSAYIPYGYTGYLNYTLSYYASLEFSLLWRIYVENHNNAALIKAHQMADIDNLRVIGFPKMDSLQAVIENFCTQERRKKIIIAPHHSVAEKSPLHLSNFLRLSAFFLELPLLYPQIDFVFRPHPLLFIELIKHQVCGGGGVIPNSL